MRRLLALAVILALAVSGAALGARGEPQKRLTPADQARAKAMLLLKTDLGVGFRAVPTGGAPDFDYYCRALDESDLVVTGEAKSQGFVGSFESYGSASQVYASTADARTSWRRGTSPAGFACTVEGFRKFSRSQGVGFVSYRRLPFPSVAPSTVAYRWVTSANGVRIYADVVAMMRSRAHAVLYFVRPVSPIEKAYEVELARRLSQRMAKAMRGA